MGMSFEPLGSGRPGGELASEEAARPNDLAVAFVILAGLTVLLTGEVSSPIRGSVLVGAVTLGAGLAAWLSPRAAVRRVAVLSALVAACLPLGRVVPWPAPIVLALVAFTALARARPELRPAGGLRRGQLALGGVVAIATGTAVVLVTWMRLVEPDLSDAAEVYLPEAPLPVLALAFLGFAMVNAAAEELLYRGHLQPMLGSLLGSAGGAVVIQATVFGLNHWNGIPRGPSGIVLAGFYGLVLGVLRERSGGLFAPWLAHVGADLVIAVMLASSARIGG